MKVVVPKKQKKKKEYARFLLNVVVAAQSVGPFMKVYKNCFYDLLGEKKR